MCCRFPFAISSAITANVSSLADICTAHHVQAALPRDVLPGIKIHPSSVSAEAVYHVDFPESNYFPSANDQSYCNVTFSYSHEGRGDLVNLWYWMPPPDRFRNRYLSTGGGGYSITMKDEHLPGGIMYGASVGTTDGGFGDFGTPVSEVILLEDGSLDYQHLHMFSYKATHELTVLGKQFTRQFYNLDSSERLYSYYQGCSEGGREGLAQIQRFPHNFDGAIIGAPALRFVFQQLLGLAPAVFERHLDNFPKPCALQKINTEIIKYCDHLDGRIDGVVSRTDRCKSNLDLRSFLGVEYSCPMQPQTPFNPEQPSQKGKISEGDIVIAHQTITGPRTLSQEQIDIGYQPSAGFASAHTVYDSETNTWTNFVDGFGFWFVERLLRERNNTDTIPDLSNWTPDTIRDITYEGWQKFDSTLQTTWPDLSRFRDAGGKVIHFHGESDGSIPAASSVRYFESVRHVMHPKMSYNESIAALNGWYRFYLVNGGGHCEPDPLQCNGPFPQTNLATMIDWVERGIEPTTLNGTVLQSCAADQRAHKKICPWPLRPCWPNKDDEMICTYDQESVESWNYDLDAFLVPVY